jgi:hypothetical protein
MLLNIVQIYLLGISLLIVYMLMIRQQCIQLIDRSSQCLVVQSIGSQAARLISLSPAHN